MVLIGWRLLNLCLMLLKCVCVFVFVRPAATGEVGPLLQRTPGVEPPLCPSQLRSVLCPGSQEDRYCKFFLIISSFVPFLHTQRVIGLVLKKMFISLGLCFAAMSFRLMKEFKEQNLPVRPHYFWPLLTQHLKDKNTAGKCTHSHTHTQPA